jgi:tRNA-Thr(GGU) m(6)t(6)A37 methyltransferase TsaA
MEILLHPIGFVRNEYRPGNKPPTWREIPSRIEMDPRWTEALGGLEGFSHVIVLSYLHLSRGHESPTLIRPQGRSAMPLIGFFGTRTPARPNPIAVSIVPLERREGNLLYVRNLDMYDGTPILDIKPYITRSDCHPDAAEPEWIDRLRDIQDQETA